MSDVRIVSVGNRLWRDWFIVSILPTDGQQWALKMGLVTE